MPRPPRVKRMTERKGVRAGICQYPSFHYTGSVTGMRKKFYGNDAFLVRCGPYIYKVPKRIYDMAE